MPGIAALLVVLVHAIDIYDQRPDLPRSFLQDLGHFNDFGASGVDMFFVLSGFVMAHAMLNPTAASAPGFIANRLIWVVPYYWLATLPFLVLSTAAGIVFTPAQFVTTLAMFPLASPHLFLTPVLFVGWTLAFELAFYIIVALAILVAPQPERRLGIALQMVLLLALVGTAWPPEADLLAIWLNPIWFEFAWGMLAYQVWRDPRRAPTPIWSATVLAAGLIGLGASIAFGFPFRVIMWGILDQGAGLSRALIWGLPYAAVLLGLLGLTAGPWGRSLAGSGAWRWGTRIGDASYSLYLLHPLSIFAYTQFAPANRISGTLVITVLVAFNAAVAVGAHRWVEQPLLTKLRRMLIARRDSDAVPAPA